MLLIILYAIFGIFLIVIIALRPHIFWPLLIFVSVGTTGLMVKGYCFIDEYFIACILVGGFWAMLTGRVTACKNHQSSLRLLMFLMMICYMVIESVFGVLVNKDWRIIRWIIYYVILGVLAIFAHRVNFPVPGRKNLLLIIAGSGALYLFAYLVYGIYYETTLGYLGRFATQGELWSGSAYAVFPLVVVIPAVIFLIIEHLGFSRLFSWFVLGLSILIAEFYYSRVSWFVIILFLSISLLMLKLRRQKVIAGLFCIIIIFSILRMGSTTLVDSAKFLLSPRSSDIDRNLQVKISLEAISKDLKTLFFGYGVHSHHYVLLPYKKEYYAKYLPGEKVGSVVRTTAFAAILTDTGLIGITLLVINFLLCILSVFIQGVSGLKKGLYVYCTVLLISFIWLFVANIQDIMLFYLLFMPFGLVAQLSRQSY